MVRNNKFTDVLDKIDGQLKMMQVRAAMTRFYYESDELLLAYEQALRLEEHSEKCVLQARNLPVYTGVREAYEAVSGIVCNCIGAKIGFTEEGWFYLSIPMLLPKKSPARRNISARLCIRRCAITFRIVRPCAFRRAC